MQDIIIIVIMAALGLFFLTDIVLAFYCFKLKKRLDLFSGEGKDNLEEFLVSQKVKIDRQGKKIEKILQDISMLNEISKKSLQKLGVVRFNAFKEVGGDQSFSVALLDSLDNGFVITGFYSREGNRVYVKPIEKGSSPYPLSGEEKEAIEKAIS